jgi:hypothetical protein
MIHLGQTAGRKNHPEDASEKHDPEDFSIVHVDDNENVVEVVNEGTSMPSTERRQENDTTPDPENIRKHIEELREQGLDEQAEKAEQMLLGE